MSRHPDHTRHWKSLCQSCWYRISAFIRRSGKLAADAGDLCQGFFERVLSTRLFAAADPEKGRLRTFLLTALSH
jgi:RNA polymerase sigma-70 factor (ECF subfamily)